MSAVDTAAEAASQGSATDRCPEVHSDYWVWADQIRGVRPLACLSATEWSPVQLRADSFGLLYLAVTAMGWALNPGCNYLNSAAADELVLDLATLHGLPLDSPMASEVNDFYERRMPELEDMHYREYLSSPEWKHRRESALRRAGHRCQLCNAASALHVHHRTYKARGYEDPADLTVLCSGCHSMFHKSRKLAS